MSHTNSTTNYNLPQFVGTDQPAWLTDINGAFSAIDTAVKNASDTATTASGAATTANTSIGTLSNLNTSEKTNLVGAINEVNVNLGTTAGVASQANTAATNAQNSVTSLADYLTLTTFTSYTTGTDNFVVTAGVGTIPNGYKVYVAKNVDGTVAKIYGTLGITNSSVNSASTIKLNVDTGLRPETNITIIGQGITADNNASGQNNSMMEVVINTDGTIEFKGYHFGSGCQFLLMNGLIFLKDFGDTPVNN